MEVAHTTRCEEALIGPGAGSVRYGCCSATDRVVLGRREKGQSCAAQNQAGTLLSPGGVGMRGVHRGPSLGLFPKAGGLTSGSRV